MMGNKMKYTVQVEMNPKADSKCWECLGTGKVNQGRGCPCASLRCRHSICPYVFQMLKSKNSKYVEK